MFLNILSKSLRLRRPQATKSIASPKFYSTLTLSPNRSNISYHTNPPGEFRLVGQTIPEYLEQISSSKPNGIAYTFCATQTSFSFLELKQRVDELAQGFLRLDLQKGDRVALMLPNVPELILSLFALAQIGCISVLMNPAYNVDEVEYMLKKTEAKVFVILDNFRIFKHYDLLNRTCPELIKSPKGEIKSKNLPNLRHVVVVNNQLEDAKLKYPGTWSFHNDLAKFNGSSIKTPKIEFDDTVALLFTSGTTGFPKAAPLTHFGLTNSARFGIRIWPGTAESYRIACFPIPIFHIFALIGGILAALINGTKSVFPFLISNTQATLKAIEAEKCTSVFGPPTIFFDLINHPDRHKHNLSSLESIMTGASVVPKDLLLRVKKHLNLKTIINVYGATEYCGTGTQTRASDIEKSELHAYETIGTAQPYVEIKITNPVTGEIVERNVDGEICVRSYGVIKGYWKDEEKTKGSIDENRWFHSGDIGCMTDDGYIIYKTRIKEIVIRGGINIYPPEIERLLRTHPSVLDCYVFGVHDERLGEELAVWIKPKPSFEATCSEKDIKEFAGKHIAAFKIPRYVRFVDSFPVSATGKIQKFKMTERMNDELKEKKRHIS